MLFCCCALLTACAEDEQGQPSADTFDDTAEVDAVVLPPCPEGERQDGVCPPAPPQFQDWVCPAGWTQTPALTDADGGLLSLEGVTPFMRCEPPPWIEPATDCEPGTMPLYGHAECMPHGDSCPASGQSWPDEGVIRGRVPEFTGRIWYALQGASAGGDGSISAPFASPQQAQDAASPGDIIALSVGTFDGQFSIQTSTAWVGACVAQTILTGPAVTSSEDRTPILSFSANGGARLRDLTLTGSRQGIRIEGISTPVILSDLFIDEVVAAGIVIKGANTAATLTDVWIANTQPDPITQNFGNGLQATEGASVELTRVSLTQNHNLGVLFAEGQLTAQDIVVADTQPNASTEELGIGLMVAQSEATVSRVALLRNHTYGALIQGQTTLSASDLTARDTRAGQKDQFRGHGLYLTGKSAATLRGVTMVGNVCNGMNTWDSTLDVDGLWVSDTKPCIKTPLDNYVFRRAGLVMNAGTQATIQHAAFAANGSAGIDMDSIDNGEDSFDTTRTVLKDIWISDTRAGFVSQGVGLRVAYKSEATVERAVLLQNYGTGICVEDAALTLSDGVVAQGTGSSLQEFDTLGMGVRIGDRYKGEEDTTASFQRLYISQADVAGLSINSSINPSQPGKLGDPSEVTVKDLTVDRTEPQVVDEDWGVGLLIEGPGHTLTLERAAITNSFAVGLSVSSNSSLDATDLRITDTKPRKDIGRFGTGAQFLGGAQATLTHLFIARNQFFGLAILDAKTSVTANHAIIQNTEPNDPALCRGETCGDNLSAGGGIFVAASAELTLTNFNIQDNAWIGLFVENSLIDTQDGLITRNLIGLTLLGEFPAISEIFRNVLLTGNNVDQDFSEIKIPSFEAARETLVDAQAP